MTAVLKHLPSNVYTDAQYGSIEETASLALDVDRVVVHFIAANKVVSEYVASRNTGLGICQKQILLSMCLM